MMKNLHVTFHIIQGISMGIQRGNAHSIMGTLGPQQKLEEYFLTFSYLEQRNFRCKLLIYIFLYIYKINLFCI